MNRSSPLPPANGNRCWNRSAPSFRDEIIQAVAAELKTEPPIVEASLFADLKSEQRLTQFKDITPERLLERYNVALAQSILLRSTGVDILIRGETPARYRQLFRQIKFHRLICEVERISEPEASAKGRANPSLTLQALFTACTSMAP